MTSIHEIITTPQETIPLDVRVDLALGKLGLAGKITNEFYDDILVLTQPDPNEDDVLPSTYGFYVAPYDYQSVRNYPFLRTTPKEGLLTVADLAFQFTLKKPDGSTKEVRGESAKTSISERIEIAAQGLKGVVAYITLIEAGVIDRPDVLVGSTNKTMAVAAKRVGLLNAEKWCQLQKQGRTSVPDEVDIDIFLKQAKLVEPDFNDTYEDYRIEADVYGAWIYTEFMRRTTDPLVAEYSARILNEIFASPLVRGFVLGTYDDFREASLRSYLELDKLLPAKYLVHAERGLRTNKATANPHHDQLLNTPV